MRLSFGVVTPYSANNSSSGFSTTTKGIFEKVERYKGDSDFWVQPALLDLLSKKDFGKYADKNGFKKLINLITSSQVHTLYLTHKDRLLSLVS